MSVIKKLPNALSLLRIVSMPVLIAVAIGEHRTTYFMLLVISQFTDFLDGYLARKLHAQSRLGAKLDILGDACNYLVGVVGLFVFFPRLVSGMRIGFILVFAVLFIARFIVAKRQKGEWIYSVPLLASKINFYVQSILVMGLYYDVAFVPVLFYCAFFAGIAESVLYLRSFRTGDGIVTAQA